MPLRHATGPSFLQIAVVDGSGEGDHIPDVAHAGEVHDAPLKAQAEAGVTGGTVLPQVQIEAVILLPEAQLPDAVQEDVVVVLTPGCRR